MLLEHLTVFFFFNKELPISQRLSVILCFSKADKPGRLFLKIGDWLLFKTYFGCVSLSSKNVLDYLISDTQSGFLKGWYIGKNTRLSII